MTSRERCRTAMSGGAADCVPLIPQICHPHAIRALGLDWRPTMLECVRNPALVNDLQVRCARHYGVDGVRLWILRDRWEVEDEGEIVWAVDPKTGDRAGRVDLMGGGWVQPLDTEPTVCTDEDVDALPVPTAQELADGAGFGMLREQMRRGVGDLFLIGAPGAMTVDYVTRVRGKQQAMMDLLERPDFVRRIIHKATDIAIQSALAYVQVGVDALYIGETFGGVIGPRLFEEFSVPAFSRFVQALSGAGALIYLHICGNSTRLLELMADTGVDCIEPLDPLGGVSVADAKARVGGRVALMGGVNTVLLAHGTLQQVQADVQRCLGEGAPGGGYLLAAGDMLPTETVPDKVHAMVEAAHGWAY